MGGEICRKFVYDKIGEDELYEHFRQEGTISPNLCVRETRDCQLGPKVAHKKESSKKRGSGEKKEDKHELALDVSTFIAKLAKKHGAAKGEYTRKRRFSEWEALFTQVAERISHTSTDKIENLIRL